MTQARRNSIRKRGKAALALGAAGVSLAMTGAASATAPTTNEPSQDNARRFILGEEEISDVSLATFQVFDRENPPLSQGIRVARGAAGAADAVMAAAAAAAGALMAAAAAVLSGALMPVAAAAAPLAAVALSVAALLVAGARLVAAAPLVAVAQLVAAAPVEEAALALEH